MVIAAAGVLRLRGGLNDLWFDEIWSLFNVRSLTSCADILLRLHIDNNHPLNTLFLFLMGPQRNWVVYRIPSMLAGAGTVVTAWLIGKKRDELGALTAATTVGFSFLLIQYSSEARGYSLAVFFAFLGYYLIERYLEKPHWSMAAGFSLCAVLGFLSHLTFIHFYLGVLLWSLWRWRTQSRRRFILSAAACHALPLAFLVFLYQVFIRRMEIGGGPEYRLLDIVLQAASLSIGGPTTGMGVVLCGAAAAALLVAALAALPADGDRIFFVSAIVLAPALVVLVARPAVIFERYFLLPAAFFQLLLGLALPKLWEKASWGKPLALLLAALFLAGNGRQTLRLLRYGRGDYLNALTLMAERTKGPVVTVGSDHDSRNKVVLAFYAPYLKVPKSVAYFDVQNWPPEGPEWFLTHSFDPAASPPPVLGDARGHRYELLRAFPFAALSGWQWFLYHNAAFAMK